MAKFVIKDEDTGKNYTVEEVDEMPEEVIEEKEEVEDEEAPVEEAVLTVEEIAVLKKLAPHVEELLALLTPAEEEVEDEEPVEEEVKEEEVVDTEEEVKEVKKDARDSFGSIKRKPKDSISDSIDSELEINDAWAKRYNK